MAKVRLPDGSVLEAPDGSTVQEFTERIGADLAKAAVAAKINNEVVDLSTAVSGEAELTIITKKDQHGLEIMRHSCAHVMAEAICSIWPEAKLVYGPTVEDGFYYDIDLDKPIRPDDFERIEDKMSEIVKADMPFKRIEVSRNEAIRQMSGDKYKLDNISRAEGDIISFYSHGNGFKDLCRGPHVPSTGRVGSFKVMSVAGAYWHGDATQKMLQRVYGTAWRNRKELDDYLKRQKSGTIGFWVSNWNYSASMTRVPDLLFCIQSV
jgi:threonyl-tRNA synthetase